jgi:hypothetical protein
MAEPRTFSVTYDDGTIVKVKQAKLKHLDDLITLQRNLLDHFMWGGALMGSILLPTNTAAWNDIDRIAALLPLVGGGFLEPRRIEDLDTFCQVFFTRTASTSDDGGIYPADSERYLPSEIARLHGLDFIACLLEARQQTINRLNQATVEPVTEPETPTEEDSSPSEAQPKKRQRKAKTDDLPVLAEEPITEVVQAA